MSTYKKLLNNSLLFAIGTVGSKVISIIFIPLYTYFLSTEEYGQVDLFTVAINLIIPILSGGIIEGILRFIMDKSQDEIEIFSNSIFIALIGCLISLLLIPLFLYLGLLNDYILYFYAILVLQILGRFLAQFARALNKIKLYAFNGILITFLTAFFNLIFLVKLNYGVHGYFLSIIFANFISIIFLTIGTQTYRYINYKKVDINTIIMLLKYSFPLIPTDLMWWLINSSSRFFITTVHGFATTGLFGVASRIPSLISIINQIFNKAWQLSVIEEYENNSKSEYYRNVFSYYLSILFICVSFITIFLKPIFYYIFPTEYYLSWKATPFLLLGSIFSALAGFFGVFYIASKETVGIFKTTVISGITSLVLNLFMVPTFGFVGAGISTMISHIILFFVRYVDTVNSLKFDINWKLLIMNGIYIILQIAILFLEINFVTEFLLELSLFILLIITNRNVFFTFKRILIGYRTRIFQK